MKYITLIVFMLCGISLHAQLGVPKVVTDGLAAYQKSGCKDAVAVWLKGSALENDADTQINITGALTRVDAAYGKMIGFEQIRNVTIAPSLHRVYILLKFEKGPLYASFDCYKTEKDWVIPTLDFNTKAASILPPSILAGVQP